MSLLDHTQVSFSRLLTPVAPFDTSVTPYLPNLNTLDFLGALRLSVILRQLRRQNAGTNDGVTPKGFWWHDLFMTLTVVFGGEMLASAMLASPPSFMISPTVTLLFVCSHIVANLIPDAIIPNLSIHTELPLSILDALTRSMLVCDGVDNMIKSNPNPLIRSSPMALVFTSTALGNVGFAFVNIFSMLSPNGWSVSAPPELGAYGWMTADLWVAPLMSALFATLTQSQPFWVELQRLVIAFVTPEVLSGFVEAEVRKDGVFDPMSKESARAVCAVFMGALFASRAVKNGWSTAVEDAKKARKSTAPSPIGTTPSVKVTSLTGANGKFVQHSPKRRVASGAKAKKE